MALLERAAARASASLLMPTAPAPVLVDVPGFAGTTESVGAGPIAVCRIAASPWWTACLASPARTCTLAAATAEWEGGFGAVFFLGLPSTPSAAAEGGAGRLVLGGSTRAKCAGLALAAGVTVIGTPTSSWSSPPPLPLPAAGRAEPRCPCLAHDGSAPVG